MESSPEHELVKWVVNNDIYGILANDTKSHGDEYINAASTSINAMVDLVESLLNLVSGSAMQLERTETSFLKLILAWNYDFACDIA